MTAGRNGKRDWAEKEARRPNDCVWQRGSWRRGGGKTSRGRSGARSPAGVADGAGSQGAEFMQSCVARMVLRGIVRAWSVLALRWVTNKRAIYEDYYIYHCSHVRQSKISVSLHSCAERRLIKGSRNPGRGYTTPRSTYTTAVHFSLTGVTPGGGGGEVSSKKDAEIESIMIGMCVLRLTLTRMRA